MGILSDIDITIEQSDNLVKEIAFKDYRLKARDFIKKYCQYGDVEHDIYWDNYVIENNIWGEDCKDELTKTERIRETSFAQVNSYDYKVNFRSVKAEDACIDVRNRNYPFVGQLVYGPITERTAFEFSQNAVYATTFECEHDCESIILRPRTNSTPVVIKGYGAKQLPEWLMFERSQYKAQGYRRTLTDDNYISFLLINCNLSRQEIINHVVQPQHGDKPAIYIDIIETY